MQLGTQPRFRNPSGWHDRCCRHREVAMRVGLREGPSTGLQARRNNMAVQGLQSSWLPGVAAVVVLMSNLSQPALAQEGSWTGPARVVDGDTLVIGTTRFRLYGVDAPESKQSCVDARGASYACGLVSKDALTKKVGNQNVTCNRKAVDQYGREVAVCSLQELTGTQDLNRWLVDNGLAVAYREYGKDYIPAEDAAKAARKGIWAGSFEYPAKWRKEEKAGIPHPPLSPIARYFPPPPPTAPPLPALATVTPPNKAVVAGRSNAPPPPPEVCGKGVLPIKGNIGSKGAKIYHMPGGRYYDGVLIEVEKGEKYFCSEQDAIAGGFRPVAAAPPSNTTTATAITTTSNNTNNATSDK